MSRGTEDLARCGRAAQRHRGVYQLASRAGSLLVPLPAPGPCAHGPVALLECVCVCARLPQPPRLTAAHALSLAVPMLSPSTAQCHPNDDGYHQLALTMKVGLGL